MKKEETATYQFVNTEKNLFDEVQRANKNSRSEYDVTYSILNYKKILADMCEYLEGYCEYYEKQSGQYSAKLLSTTAKFYDAIFDSNKYRTDMTLTEMHEIERDFLIETKKLQDIMTRVQDNDSELEAMMIMTNNQYKKISRVFRDDCRIWLWLVTSESYKPYQLDVETRNKFNDKSTPVMHKKKR